MNDFHHATSANTSYRNYVDTEYRDGAEHLLGQRRNRGASPIIRPIIRPLLFPYYLLPLVRKIKVL